jgi:hypothetical protein
VIAPPFSEMIVIVAKLPNFAVGVPLSMQELRLVATLFSLHISRKYCRRCLIYCCANDPFVAGANGTSVVVQCSKRCDDGLSTPPQRQQGSP